MTPTHTHTDDPTSDDEELPDHQCAEVADETGERCRNAAIPGLDRCHAHVDDYADLAEALGSEPDRAPPRQAATTPQTLNMKTDASTARTDSSDASLKNNPPGVSR